MATFFEKLWLLGTVLSYGRVIGFVMIGDWQNTQVSREISLQQNTVKVTVNVDMDCSRCTGPMPYAYLRVPAVPLGKHALTFFEGLGSVTVSDSESGEQLQVEDSGVDEGYRYLAVTFPDKKRKASLNVDMIFGRMYRPLPEEILELQEQMVEYADTLYWSSPYPTAKETTTVRLLNEQKIERVAPKGDSTVTKGRTITFGPFTDITPVKENAVPELLHVHVTHPFPLPYLAKVYRSIEVSHWGSVSINGKYELVNEAAKLGGEFSRTPFSISKWSEGENPYKVTSALASIQAVLPRSAHNINYRDAIGNVSTTHARREGKKYIAVELSPRFPMLGGWKDDFEFSYDLPSKTTLQVSSSDPHQYVLSVAFNQPFVKVFTQEQEIEIVLPAGASDININSPRGLSTFDYIAEGRYSWLDFTTPRRLIRLTSAGIIVPERNALNTKIQISYKMPSGMGVLDKPALLIIYIFALFLAYIIFNRVSLRIVTGKAEASKIDSQAWDYSVSLKVADLFEDLCHANEKMMGKATGPVYKLDKAVTKQTSTAESLCGKMKKAMGMDAPEGKRKFTDEDLAKRVVATCEEYASLGRSLAKATSKVATSEGDSKHNIALAEEKSAINKYNDVENLCINLIQKMEEEGVPSVRVSEMIWDIALQRRRREMEVTTPKAIATTGFFVISLTLTEQGNILGASINIGWGLGCFDNQAPNRAVKTNLRVTTLPAVHPVCDELAFEDLLTMLLLPSLSAYNLSSVSKPKLADIIRTLSNRYTRTKGGSALSVAAAVGVLLLYRNLKRANEEGASGVELKDDKQAKPRRKEHGVDAIFLLRLAKLLRIMVPGLLTREALTLALQTCALVSRSLLSIHIAEVSGKGLQAVVQRDGKLFFSSVADFVRPCLGEGAFLLMSTSISIAWNLRHLPSSLITGITASVVNSGLKFMTSLLGAWFAENLTHHIHKTYLHNKNYYFVSAHTAALPKDTTSPASEPIIGDGKGVTALDNVDHRLVVDVENFAKQLADLYSRTFKPALDVILCTARLGTSLRGYSGPVLLYAYFIGVSAAIRVTSPPMSKLIAHQQSLDGNYRRAQARLVSHHEEIAFLDGGAAEEQLLNDRLALSSGWKEKLAAIQFRQGCIDQFGLKYFASVIGWPVIALPFITMEAPKGKKEQLKRITQYRVADNLIQTSSASLCDLILTYKKVQTLAGYTARVSELMESLEKSDERISQVRRDSVTENGPTSENIFMASDVTITTPDQSRILLKDFKFEAKPGVRVLITGPNGAGKTSLFRVLAGLWPALSGDIKMNSPSGLEDSKISVMYLPQTPYLVLGTLRDQVTYPKLTTSCDDNDDAVIKCLEAVGLGRLLSTYSLDTAVWEWADVLSGGERQRIGWARLLYHRPSVVVLDEATSAIAVDDEGPLYECLINMHPDITIFSIAHRPSLRRLHTCELHIDGDGHGNWSLRQLNGTDDNGSPTTEMRTPPELGISPKTDRTPIGLFGAKPVSP
ncbi:ATP-binding cassette sub- D member 3 [Perkinsus chesapeaki]|uniref:ATP-binding cassette sub- D member 3 n=1 Tax=Perkinsus chesapeaki TaxID=330153 RepID=A0A7J6LRS6_PERCH|nr:ATP-binding cassette sub- D member 3 [Perkinsus chesapeaki]